MRRWGAVLKPRLRMIVEPGSEMPGPVWRRPTGVKLSLLAKVGARGSVGSKWAIVPWARRALKIGSLALKVGPWALKVGTWALKVGPRARSWRTVLDPRTWHVVRKPWRKSSWSWTVKVSWGAIWTRSVGSSLPLPPGGSLKPPIVVSTEIPLHMRV